MPSYSPSGSEGFSSPQVSPRHRARGAPAAQFFRVQWEAAERPEGVRVTGYVYNDLMYSTTNVRLSIEVLDTSGRVVAERSAWVLGDVQAGGRAFFAVPVQMKGAMYRVSVSSFDRLSREGP